MMSKTQSSCQNSKHKEWLRTSLVLDIIGNGVRQQKCGLEINLWQDESQYDCSIVCFSNAVKVAGNTKLGQCYGSRTDVFCTIDAECDGEGVKPECSVTFNGFEIIYDGDSKTCNGVENGAAFDGKSSFDYLHFVELT